MRRFVSVLKQKVFIRRPGNFLGNIPRHTASQRKKLQGARTTKAVAMLMLQQVNFYFAGCNKDKKYDKNRSHSPSQNRKITLPMIGMADMIVPDT